MNVFINNLTPFNYEKLSVLTTAVSSLSSSISSNALGCFITIETNNIRYRIDGGDPSSTEGHLVIAEQNIWFANSAAVRNFKAIAIGGDATLVVTFYR